MSLSFSDCFDDLLCAEESTSLSDESPADSSFDIESSVSFFDKEFVARIIEDERNFVSNIDYLSELDLIGRALSIAWMLKVRAFYNFQPLTAFLAINYFDRFLCSHKLPKGNGWTLQLLSVACLSLAAKMEELLVPSLLDFQVEDAKFIFEPKTIQKMELLILGVLDWRLNSITPFGFISFFANKVNKTGAWTGFIIDRSTDIILSILQEASLLEYNPSSIAAAAVLCAAREIPKLPLVKHEDVESWCDGLSKEKVMSCYTLMQKSMMVPKTLPQLRVMSRTRVRMSVNEFSSSTSSCSSSSSTTQAYSKRRKLSNMSWVDFDDDDDNISSD